MLTIKEVRNAYVEGLEIAKSDKSKKAYQIALNWLDAVGIKDTVKTNVRHTINAVNVGDVGEIIAKYLRNNNKRVLNVSNAYQNDLDTYHKSEWKTFTVANRPANGITKRRGFTALTPKGVAWFNYDIVKNYIKLNERIKLSVVYQMALDNKIKFTPLEALV